MLTVAELIQVNFCREQGAKILLTTQLFCNAAISKKAALEIRNRDRAKYKQQYSILKFQRFLKSAILLLIQGTYL